MTHSTNTDTFPLTTVRCVSSNRSGKARCEIDWDWHPPPLPDFDLWYALSGSGTMQINNKRFPIEKGACFLIRPQDRPKATQHVANRITAIFIHFSMCNLPQSSDYQEPHLPPRYTKLVQPYGLEEMLHRILDVEQSDDYGHEEEFNCLMKQVLIQLYRAHASDEKNAIPLAHQRILRNVKHFLNERLTDRSIDVHELSNTVNLSPQYLSRLFKQLSGMSIKEYRTRLKMERAMYLLTETSMNVSQVADALGYSEIYAFSKQFKQAYRSPPSHFRLHNQASSAHYGDNK